MANDSRLAQAQATVGSAGLDGWLLYDFRGLNPFPAQVLGLEAGPMLTRRWFLYVPARGTPVLIVHRIEAGGWLGLLPDPGLRRMVFGAHQELDAALRETLRGGGLLLRDKGPELVAEVLDRVTHGGDLRRTVLASQRRAVAAIRATDFGALLRERLAPVLDAREA